MNQNWNTYKLGELGEFFGGVTSIKKEDYGFGTPFIPYKNVFKNSKIDISNLELMNVNSNDLKKRNAVYGDIFFTASSETPDEVAISSVLLDHVENLTYNGFCKRLRLHNFDTLLPEFARYYFKSHQFRTQVYQYKTGDVRFNISQESLAKISITIPDIKRQKHIADILTSLDDKIELNNQMNQTLENMAQAIFKEWFVDFNFPGFDGELVDGLPRGWRMGKVGEAVNVKGGATPSTKNEKFWNGNNFWATPKDLSSAKYPILLDTERKISDLGVREISSGILEKGTLLMSSRAPIGYLAISNVPVSINQGFIAIQPKIVSNLFMLYWLQYNMDLIKSRSNGSTFQEISKTNFRAIEIMIPDEKTLESFESIVNSIFVKLLSNSIQNQTLTELRNSLLPKLMSGKIGVN